jgi:hypothetical protein
MEYELRELLANEFAGVIKTVREENWDAFLEAALKSSLDPYVALARLLVRSVEEKIAGPDPSMN